MVAETRRMVGGMNPVTMLSQLATWLQPVSSLIGALAIVFTALHALFALFGLKWSWAARAASVCAVIGVDLQRIGAGVAKVIAWIGSLAGGGGSASGGGTLSSGGARGFVRLRFLLGLAAVGGVLLACFPEAAVAPSAALVACIATLTPASSLAALVASAVSKCGPDALAILDAIIASSDPSLAPYVAEAKATRADSAKLAAFQNEVRVLVLASQRGQ